MSYDNQALETKKREIELLAEMSVGTFPQCSPAIAKAVVSAFVRMTPPTNAEPPPMRTHNGALVRYERNLKKARKHLSEFGVDFSK